MSPCIVGQIHILVAVKLMTACFLKVSSYERESLLLHVSNFRRGLHPLNVSPD